MNVPRQLHGPKFLLLSNCDVTISCRLESAKIAQGLNVCPFIYWDFCNHKIIKGRFLSLGTQRARRVRASVTQQQIKTPIDTARVPATVRGSPLPGVSFVLRDWLKRTS